MDQTTHDMLNLFRSLEQDWEILLSLHKNKKFSDDYYEGTQKIFNRAIEKVKVLGDLFNAFERMEKLKGSERKL